MNSIIKNKRDEIQRIAQKYGVTRIRVFGSVARDENDEKSDVDFLVDVEPGRSLLDLGGLQMELQEFLEVRVDIVTEAGLRHRIRDSILKDAVTL